MARLQSCGTTVWSDKLLKDVSSRTDSEAERERCRMAARLYYDGDFTQDYIAAYLGISRPWVSRLLKRARELGIVTITVEPPSGRPLALERTLARELGIPRCLIAPSSTRADAVRLAAEFLSESLRDGDIVGLGWGNTLAAMVDAFEQRSESPSGMRCVSFMGGRSVARPEIDADRLVPLLAAKLKAAPSVLNAPAFVESPHVRYLLLKEPGIRSTVKLAERTTVAVMCIGGLEDSTIRDLGTFTQRDFAELRASGAVGDVCQWFIDAEGNHIEKGPAERMISADLLRVKERARERIAVTVGEGRVDAIIGAARGKWFTTLVTSIATARALLDKLGVHPASLALAPASGAPVRTV